MGVSTKYWKDSNIYFINQLNHNNTFLLFYKQLKHNNTDSWGLYIGFPGYISEGKYLSDQARTLNKF